MALFWILIFVVVSVIFLIISIVQYFTWKDKHIVNGTIVKYKDGKFSYKNGNPELDVIAIKYSYDMEIEYDGTTVTVDFYENIKGNKASQIKIGEKFDVYFNPVNQKYRLVSSLKSDIKVATISLVAALALTGIAVAIVFWSATNGY